MRWTWIVCVAATLGCGPAVETGGGTEIEAETEVGDTGGSSGVATTAPMVTEPNPTDPSTSSGDGTGSGDVTTGASPMGGEFFVAIFATPIAPTTPFQFLAEVKVGGGQVVMSLTPLSLDLGSVDSPRDVLPPPFEVSGPIDADGAFTIEIPNVMLPGDSNPVTASDIVASMTLEGVLEDDRICGPVSGWISVPANIDLTGSRLAGVRFEGGPLPLLGELACGQ